MVRAAEGGLWRDWPISSQTRPFTEGSAWGATPIGQPIKLLRKNRVMPFHARWEARETPDVRIGAK